MPYTKQSDRSTSVLLVDDHTMFLELLGTVLSGYPDIDVVGKVSNGELALSYCKKLRPQIVLMDINIGMTDGFELAKEVRKKCPGARLIGLSMFTQAAYVKKFIRSGGSGYVTKHSETEELVEAIRTVNAGNTYYCSQIADSIDGQEANNGKENGLSGALSLREIEVIQLIRKGYTSKEIAEKLHLTPKTVELHRHKILQKLNIRNTAALITYAYRHCL